jgi:hypothetical protein
MISTATETTALAPAPRGHILGSGRGYEAMWAQANTKSFSSLKRGRPQPDGNQILPLPQHPGRTDPVIHGIRQSELDIHCHAFDASDPAQGRKSRAVNPGAQEQGDQTNLNFIDNFKPVTAPFGRSAADLLPKIYDRPGRSWKLSAR